MTRPSAMSSDDWVMTADREDRAASGWRAATNHRDARRRGTLLDHVMIPPI
jgi:hypothetical protein